MMKLAVLNGCDTAITGSCGNLIEELSYASHNHYVDCSVGFTVELTECRWGPVFFNYLNNGTTVNYVLQKACQDIKNDRGTACGYDHYSVAGNGNITIKPASYGIYD